MYNPQNQQVACGDEMNSDTMYDRVGGQTFFIELVNKL